MVSLRQLVNLFTCSGFFVLFLWSCVTLVTEKEYVKTEKDYKEEKLYRWTHPENDSLLPLIFVGGFPRSGTSLMRDILEGHPHIRCGSETHVLPYILAFRESWISTPQKALKMEEAGVEPDAMKIAVSKFMIEIIKHHDKPSDYYCNKDPFLLLYMKYVHHLFPNAKFIFMIRDGRATVHSMKSTKRAVDAYGTTDYRSVLKIWDSHIQKMHNQCKELGENICLPVHYEQLVLQPVNNTKRIFRFLNIPWVGEVLHCENLTNGTSHKRFKQSSDEVKKPIYLDALTSWFGHIPRDVERDMAQIVPMLGKLGYDPYDPTPVYGKPDEFMLGKLKL